MWNIIEWIVEPLFELFGGVYKADERKEARRFTVGCLVVVLVLIGLVAAFFYFRR